MSPWLEKEFSPLLWLSRILVFSFWRKGFSDVTNLSAIFTSRVRVALTGGENLNFGKMNVSRNGLSLIQPKRDFSKVLLP
jgi:hypothetical protein